MFKGLVLAAILLVTFAGSLFAQDSVLVEMRYPITEWAYDTDVHLTVESWVYTEADLDASSITFSANRNLVRIDSLVWSDTMLALKNGLKMFSNINVRNDTTIQAKVYTYATAGFIVDFINNEGGLVIPAGSEAIQFARLYLTLKADSLLNYANDSADFYMDSIFIPPATDFIFTVHSDGSSIVPYFTTDTLTLIKTTGVSEIHPNVIPKTFELSQNYPNPFNPTTKIEFAIPSKSHVNLVIYNALGQKVKDLVNEELDAGWKAVTWDGTDNTGNEVASGIYLYRIEAENYAQSKKMILMK